MSLYNRRPYDRGFSRKTFQYVLLAASILAIICIYLGARLWFGSTSDTHLQDVFIEQVREQDASARQAAGQLSRMGGSNTQHMLAQTRQHLYAISVLNGLSAQLVTGGGDLVPQAYIDLAMQAIDACETKILASGTIEMELNALWEQLNAIEAVASMLT